MPRDLENRMWRQIKGAFGVQNLTFVESEEEMRRAIDFAHGQLVFLEPKGARSLSEIPSGDIVLIFGNTQMGNMKYAERPNETTYRIQTPNGTDLYGTNAAAIALAVRYGQ